MRHRTPHASRLRRSRGLSLIEMLIALAITATLLTAIAAAFSSTTAAMKINDEFFHASQAARVSLARVMGQARRGMVSEKDAYNTTVNLTDDQSIAYIRLITDANQEMIYKYDSTAQEFQLYQVVNNVVGTKHVLAHHVTAANFTVGIGTDANNSKCVSRLTLAITVKEGENSVLLSGSAVPRATLSY
jgi:prepilin-type N-terminal cleavage/methylation domain-containing protein